MELWLAVLACLVLAGVLVLYALFETPAPGRPFGEFIGTIGMMLMVITETVYSLRKRVRWLHWLGSLRMWLSFHIFTGIVGPFLVLLHTAAVFGGLAGLALVMTGLVVLSGFVGRYIYTAVPRTRAGIEVSREELVARAQALQRELDEWFKRKPEVMHELEQTASPNVHTRAWSALFTRTLQDWAYRRKIAAKIRLLERAERTRLSEVKRLLERQRQVERQIASLEGMQRWMGMWRLVHVPLGVTMFATAVVHVVAALYFKGLA